MTRGEKTPARLAAELQLAEVRTRAQLIAARALAVLAYVDSLSPAMPPTEQDRKVLHQIQRAFEELPDEWMQTARAVDVVTEHDHPGWPELRRQIETMIRQARWLWANETKFHDRLLAHQWTAGNQDDLAGILNRLHRLSTLFGYPGSVPVRPGEPLA